MRVAVHPRATLARTLLLLDLVLIGVLFLNNIATGIILGMFPESDLGQSLATGARNTSAGAYAANSITLLIMLGLVPVLWLLGSRRSPVEGTLRYLRLHVNRQKALADAGWGVAWGVALLVAAWVLSFLYIIATEGTAGLSGALNSTEESSPVVTGLLSVLNWPLAILIATCAAVGEEIFFRGVLQRWVGPWWQAVFFGITHAGYGTLFQVLWPFAAGVVFGRIILNGRSLITVIVAHFVFDIVQLGIGIAA